MTIENLDGLQRVARYICASGLQPTGDTPESVGVKMLLGMEVGLRPMASLKQIAVINGRPGIFGDAGAALLLAKGILDGAPKIEWKGKPGTDTWECVVRMKRKGMGSEFIGTFSVADAKRAQLWGKVGKNGAPTPWVTYPDRQMMWRAWWFAARAGFADVLGGISGAEELMDTPPRAVEVEVKVEAPRSIDALARTLTINQHGEIVEPQPQPMSALDDEPTSEAILRVNEAPEPALEPAPPVWWFDHETPLEVAFPVPHCADWSTFADLDIPGGGKLASRAKTWRLAAQGSPEGGRAKLLELAVKSALASNEGPTKAHERAACTLAVLRAGLERKPEPVTQEEPSPELPWS